MGRLVVKKNKVAKMELDEEGKPWPRKQEATQYLQKHKIVELFNNLTSQLIYNEPSSPKEFLIEALEKLQKSKMTKREFPCLFDETNIQSIFGMLDPTGRGFITLQQYREGLLTIGVTNFEQHPPGHDVNKITPDIFAREAKLGLARASATFSDKK